MAGILREDLGDKFLIHTVKIYIHAVSFGGAEIVCQRRTVIECYGVLE